MNQPPCGNDPEPPVCPAGSGPVYVFNDDMENVASGNWTTGADSGTNHWYSPQVPNSVPYDFLSDLSYARSGQYHLWGYNQGSTADYYAQMSNGVVIPANGYLRFAHDWNFESSGGTNWDGGVLEYSDNGGSWIDAGSLFTDNGYNGVISGGNPLGSRSGFTAESHGYTTSLLDLSDLAGKNVRFRFRIGTDGLIDDYGWFVDDVAIYRCQEGLPTPTATGTSTATSAPTATSTATVIPPTTSPTPTPTVAPPGQHLLLPFLKN